MSRNGVRNGNSGIVKSLPGYRTVSGAARLLGVSRQAIFDLWNRKKLPFYEVDGRYLVSISDIEVRRRGNANA